jgi:hypothetical protein
MSFRANVALTDGELTDGRYQALEFDGTWQVIDRMTGLPAASAGRDFVELCTEDALEIAAELNRCEAEGSPSPLI